MRASFEHPPFLRHRQTPVGRRVDWRWRARKQSRRLSRAKIGACARKTEAFRMALDSSGGGIAHWKHDPLHDVVEPMTHHVIMAYNGAVQRMSGVRRFVAGVRFVHVP